MTQKDFVEQISRTFAEALKVIEVKNSDYSAENNPFSNFEIQGWLTGTLPEQAILGDIARKIARMRELVATNKEAKVADERVVDTCMDLMNYAAILKVYLENKEKSDTVKQ